MHHRKLVHGAGSPHGGGGGGEWMKNESAPSNNCSGSIIPTLERLVMMGVSAHQDRELLSGASVAAGSLNKDGVCCLGNHGARRGGRNLNTYPAPLKLNGSTNKLPISKNQQKFRRRSHASIPRILRPSVAPNIFSPSFMLSPSTNLSFKSRVFLSPS